MPEAVQPAGLQLRPRSPDRAAACADLPVPEAVLLVPDVLLLLDPAADQGGVPCCHHLSHGGWVQRDRHTGTAWRLFDNVPIRYSSRSNI